MRTFFTSDLHFDHRNIVRYCQRPWPDVDAMNLGLVQRWNEVVDHDDRVFVIGDFSLHAKAERVDRWLFQLHGEKHLIRGNHDDRRACRQAKGWASVENDAELTVDGVKVRLCHHRLDDWRGPRLMLHGHAHSRHPATAPFAFDVGVDANDYRPHEVSRFVALMGTYRYDP